MKKKPNIVLITIDALKKDLFLKLNKKNTIDRLFYPINNCISCGSNTAPAFKIMITGDYNSIMDRYHSLKKEKKVLSEELKKEGYMNIAVFGNCPCLSKFNYYHRGFDYFEDFVFRNEPYKKKKEKAIFKSLMKKKLPETIVKMIKLIKKTVRNLDYRIINNETIQKKFASVSAKQVNLELIKKLRNEKKKGPFFIWLHYLDTHWPYRLYKKKMRQREWNQIEDYIYNSTERVNAKSFKKSEKKMFEILKKSYEVSVKYVLKEVSLLFENLIKEKIIDDESLVILTTDHGVEYGEYGFLGHGKISEQVYNIPLCISKNVKINSAKEYLSLKDLHNIILDFAKSKKIKDYSKEKAYCFSITDKDKMLISFDFEQKEKYIHGKCISKKGEIKEFFEKDKKIKIKD